LTNVTRAPATRTQARAVRHATLGILLLAAPAARAIPLDEDGTINVNLRAYVNARFSTMATQSTRPSNPDSFGGTYPFVGAGNVIQNRYFLETKWQHDLLPLLEDYLPDGISALGYLLSYRGEYEGIYDFGPKSFSQNLESLQEIQEILRRDGTSPDVAQTILSQQRHRLREVASYRNRLFQVYGDIEWGPIFLRVGRQNLAWGETDVFRLLDNINPIDDSFGGFFIDLDERRVPLNMVRGSAYLGTFGPLDQTFVEGYVAVDNTVAFIPGTPLGSPWSAPLGPPSGQTPGTLIGPCGFCDENVRGGGRVVTNVGDFTFTLASYFTFLDVQAVRFVQPIEGETPHFIPGVTAVEAQSTAPRVWINGASMTTAVPELKSVLRSEIAWFRDEPLFRGPTPDGFPGTSTLDPDYLIGFAIPVLNLNRNGGVNDPNLPSFDTVYRTDTLNFAVGWDMNQYIRFLNATQTFFFSAQLFYRHIFGFDPLTAYPVPVPNNPTRVVERVQDEILQTLLVTTTYNTPVPGTSFNVQTTPGLAVYYDWQGMIAFQPSLRFARDPWRLTIDYNAINSGVFRGLIGFVRDRSNVRIQVEFVI
jgi:hypothetical protein